MADFFGKPVGILENQFLRLEYLLEAGPRIVRLFTSGSQENLFAELPESIVPTPYGDYHFTGGHRLWHAPEQMPRSYIPDNEGLQVQEFEDGVKLIQPVEAPTGILKSMQIHLIPDRAAVTIDHFIENGGQWAVELAPWAITQLRLGGTAVLPQQLTTDPHNLLLPDRVLTMWSYSMFSDSRLHLHDDFIFMEGKAAEPACKIGVMNKRGWAGYLSGDVFFNKRFTLRPGLPYPDFGCNNEIYVGHEFLELETLGPLTCLEAGQTMVHTETWELTTGLDYPQTADGLRALVKDLGLNEAEMALSE